MYYVCTIIVAKMLHIKICIDVCYSIYFISFVSFSLLLLPFLSQFLQYISLSVMIPSSATYQLYWNIEQSMGTSNLITYIHSICIIKQLFVPAININ